MYDGSDKRWVKILAQLLIEEFSLVLVIWFINLNKIQFHNLFGRGNSALNWFWMCFGNSPDYVIIQVGAADINTEPKYWK